MSAISANAPVNTMNFANLSLSPAPPLPPAEEEAILGFNVHDTMMVIAGSIMTGLGSATLSYISKRLKRVQEARKAVVCTRLWEHHEQFLKEELKIESKEQLHMDVSSFDTSELRQMSLGEAALRAGIEGIKTTNPKESCALPAWVRPIISWLVFVYMSVLGEEEAEEDPEYYSETETKHSGDEFLNDDLYSAIYRLDGAVHMLDKLIDRCASRQLSEYYLLAQLAERVGAAESSDRQRTAPPSIVIGCPPTTPPQDSNSSISSEVSTVSGSLVSGSFKRVSEVGPADLIGWSSRGSIEQGRTTCACRYLKHSRHICAQVRTLLAPKAFGASSPSPALGPQTSSGSGLAAGSSSATCTTPYVWLRSASALGGAEVTADPLLMPHTLPR